MPPTSPRTEPRRAARRPAAAPPVTMDAALVAAHVAGDTQVLVVRGVVDRHAAGEIDYLIWHGIAHPPSPRVVVDISRVDEVSGALIGALLRASRQLAWRNRRRLTIVCPHADLRSRLEIAGLDELADVVASLDA